MIGFFYPDPVKLKTGEFSSFSPYADADSLITLNVYQGDLGLDTGAPVNVYSLDTASLDPGKSTTFMAHRIAAAAGVRAPSITQ